MQICKYAEILVKNKVVEEYDLELCKKQTKTTLAYTQTL